MKQNVLDYLTEKNQWGVPIFPKWVVIVISYVLLTPLVLVMPTTLARLVLLGLFMGWCMDFIYSHGMRNPH